MFFMAGDAIGTAAMPVHTEAEIYRAKDIETFDTCYVRGEFANGCRFMYISTHSGDVEVNPIFSYTFEKAVVTMNEESGQTEVIARYNDGRVKSYGNAGSGRNHAQKLLTMIDAVRGLADVPCGIETVMPHIVISNAMFEQARFTDFPRDIVYRDAQRPGSFVRGLVEQSMVCFDTLKLPSELGYAWAAAPAKLDYDGYDRFIGADFV
jgi:hypothetical protein